MSAEDRYIRLCPTHRTTLKTEGDGFGCSKCGGRIGRWVIHDRKNNRDVEEGSDDLWLEAMAKGRAPRAVPGTSSSDAVLAHLLGRDFEFSTRAPKKGSQVVMAQAKLVDPERTATIMVRLLHANTGVPYRVEWEEREVGVSCNGPKRDSGRPWCGMTENLAKAAFLEAVAGAVSAGWLLVPGRFGTGRAIPTRPVPLLPRDRGKELAAPIEKRRVGRPRKAA